MQYGNTQADAHGRCGDDVIFSISLCPGEFIQRVEGRYGDQ